MSDAPIEVRRAFYTKTYERYVEALKTNNLGIPDCLCGILRLTHAKKVEFFGEAQLPELLQGLKITQFPELIQLRETPPYRSAWWPYRYNIKNNIAIRVLILEKALKLLDDPNYLINHLTH